MKEYIFDIDPVPKPRQTRRDKWLNPPRPAVGRYRAFADSVRETAALKGLIITGVLNISFHVPMPKSWGKKKRRELIASPHTSRPDIDNLAKAFMDAVLKEDCTIWHLTAVKYWSETGQIIVRQ